MENAVSGCGYRTVFLGPDREPNCPVFLFEEAELPTLEEGQILVKILYAAICKSDVHTFTGARKELTPSVLGHEAVAEILVSRRKDSNLLPGQRVTFSVCDSCQRCVRCRQYGLPQKCAQMRKYGHMPLAELSGFNGTYSSHMVLGRGTPVVRLPAQIADVTATPANCALATAVHAVSCIPAGKDYSTGLVQGAGLLGVYVAALLKDRGFSRVLCTDTNRSRLLSASNFGATPIDADVTGVSSVDVVVEACGGADVLQAGIRALRPGGLYLWVGMVTPNSRLDDITGEAVIRKCITIKGIHNYNEQHLQDAVSFLARTCDQYRYDLLFCPTAYPLRELEAAFAAAQTGTYHRVLIKP